ncbi:head maturation protease, ClpP-related [Macrococcus armenti]|uniref:head maturation protease, ClpP-related n=1 Tax=Macrococcus armenti TaxID=2875764 RepID=UPI001CC94993|nr:head maturation protease, ClpP-related [Macrococcus armenti]UBH07849.1 Clp protease ClpP [Macrococcus armenti]UBH14857.1 Clp protease ClpP [Macrococcus armenti]UBH17217.1 Clp protease ClpP [Macrococcus armenti]UBH19482.1 Clp protease ClpP [Macrococcus armenti]
MTGRILNVSKTENIGQIDIYGEIVPESWRWSDEESAYHFKDTLTKLGDVDEIIVNINSPGGDVFEGITIHNMLKRHKAKVIVNIDGLAASIASVIAMAGDVVRMPSNSMMMIHNAMGGMFGNANDMREIAELLDKVTGTLMETYLAKTDKLNIDSLKALLDAETWMTAEEAFSYGLIDEVITSKKLVACASKSQLTKFNKTPDHVIKMVETPEETEPLEEDVITLENVREIVTEVVQEELEKYDLPEKVENNIKNKVKRLYL